MRILAANHESKVDWARASSHLDERGFVLVPGVLTKTICVEIADYYIDDHRFRSRIEMARHSFGQGEYKYFKYPLPDAIQQLRTSLYPQLAPLANQWRERLGSKESSLSRKSVGLHRAMSPRRSKAPNTFAAEIWRRRFQLFASRSIRRTRVSVSSYLFLEPARRRFCRRRIRSCGATTAPAIPC